ncbi:hypothetical protein BGX28_006339 [Mortierella sp. GBA30]|nr:hypothetical protein BGX28_006339 [Mortierella sp. GBA30]
MTPKATLLALVATLTLLIAMVEAHSWADCVDWRPKDKKKLPWTNGECHGYARKFPYQSKRKFGDLDSDSPNRHYQQNPKDFTSCSDGNHGREPGADESRQNPVSKSYGGKWGPMATAAVGQEICIRWPAKNHAVKSETDRHVFINMPTKMTNKDPSQSQLTRMTVAEMPYKNCDFIKDTDHTPCGGCFTVPDVEADGTYMMQWRWELNKNEFYTSCWDIKITKGKKGNSTTPADPKPTPTSISKPKPTKKSKKGKKDKKSDALGDDTSVFAALA